MSCECKSGKRALIVFAPELFDRYPELERIESSDVEPVPELGAVRVSIGCDSRWRSAAEWVNFLRTVLDHERMNALRGAWVPMHAKAGECTRELMHAGPLVAMGAAEGGALLRMLEERRIETHFQPIFHTQTMDVWGYECLMRGRDGDGHMISPGKLIQWAEQERLTFMLDRVCREVHLENAARAGLANRDVHVLINFMPTAIYEPTFCLRTTEAVAAKHEFKRERIIFEVVETEEVADREHLVNILAHYRRNGFKVALDDVGTGHSGLMMLADLNPDLVKLDRALVQSAEKSKVRRNICASLVDLAREQGKLILAEGIETEAQQRIMADLGIDLLQGFRFAKPAPTPSTRPYETLAARDNAL